jgi:hypothetical protein
MNKIRETKTASGNSSNQLLRLVLLLSSLLTIYGTGFAKNNQLNPDNYYFLATTDYETDGLKGVYFNICKLSEPNPSAVTIISPDNNTGNNVVTIRVNVIDGVNVDKIQLFVNGQLSGTGTAPNVFNWDTSTLIRGDYVISVKASDADGNDLNSDNVVVTVGPPNK